jgi:thiamine biosynthesis lipoprotein
MMLRRAQPWLGTLVEISAEGVDEAVMNRAIDRAFACVARVHAAMSFQAPDSELTYINRTAQTGWVRLTPALATVFAAAIDFARASDGLFDPSVAGWLVEAGQLPQHPGLPDAPAPNWRAIDLDGARVRYTQPLLVDLSGIAKGYAVDSALASLAADGAEEATVNAGGDLAHFGPTGVPVYVRLPHLPTHRLRVAEVQNGAVATSGGYFQPAALLHPVSAVPLCAQGSVTVFAPNCMTADALTKVVAADAAHAPQILAAYGAQAIVLKPDEARFCDANGWHELPLQEPA